MEQALLDELVLKVVEGVAWEGWAEATLERVLVVSVYVLPVVLR